MKLSLTQQKQLDDIVTQTRITRGKNAGKRKDNTMSIEHFDMRSFNALIHHKLVTPSEYNCDEWVATELGFSVWQAQKTLNK